MRIIGCTTGKTLTSQVKKGIELAGEVKIQ